MPVIIAGNDQQQKKYLGRMTEEPLMCVRIAAALFHISHLRRAKEVQFLLFNLYVYAELYHIKTKVSNIFRHSSVLGCQESVIMIPMAYFQESDIYLMEECLLNTCSSRTE
jgi:hypothetical protein